MTYVETLVRTPAAASEPSAAPKARRAPNGIVLLIACVAVGMMGVDTAVVNVALPSMRTDLRVGPDTLQWVVVAYGLCMGGFLLLGGRLSDRVGRRRMFLVGLGIFTLASLTSGSASAAEVLVAARAAQGLGAALIGPAALSLVAVTFAEGPERDRAIGVFGAVGGIAGTTGVVLGGLLAAGPGWRWAFWINVPIGVLLLTLALAALPRDRAADRREGRLDVAGATTVTAGLLLVVYALDHGAAHGWGSAATLALALAGIALIGAFVAIESRSAHPLMPLKIWRRGTLATANLGSLCASAALLGFIYLGSLLMQQMLGYSPLTAGVAWLSTTVTVFVAAMVAGRVAARVGARRLVIVAFLAVVTGALWLARVPAHAGYAGDVMPAFFLAGIGFGLAGPALRIGAMTGVREADAGLVAGLVETHSETGGAAGVAVVTTALVATGGLAGFHAGFVLVALIATVGAGVAAAGFRRRS